MHAVANSLVEKATWKQSISFNAHEKTSLTGVYRSGLFDNSQVEILWKTALHTSAVKDKAGGKLEFVKKKFLFPAKNTTVQVLCSLWC